MAELIIINNQKSALEDIVNEHCYFGVKTETALFYHLKDHNYFDTETAKPKKKKQVKIAQKRIRTVKITELKAIYNCKCCGYRTMDRELSLKHNCNRKPVKLKQVLHKKRDIVRHKAPEGYAQCKECSYFTKHNASLKIHMNIHLKGTPYKCTECDFSAKNLKDLIWHYNFKDLKCECGYKTHVRQQMIIHKRSHTGEKPFACGVCNFSAADRSVLHRHLKRHYA